MHNTRRTATRIAVMLACVSSPLSGGTLNVSVDCSATSMVARASPSSIRSVGRFSTTFESNRTATGRSRPRAIRSTECTSTDARTENSAGGNGGSEGGGEGGGGEGGGGAGGGGAPGGGGGAHGGMLGGGGSEGGGGR